MPALLDCFTTALTLDRPGQSFSQRLAEQRIHSELLASLDGAPLSAMIDAYITGLRGGDAPTDHLTPQAVVLAYLLGSEDKTTELNPEPPVAPGPENARAAAR
ncbi:hypothetical protein ACFFLM_02965 [Deinococcus oregonensis]|uniref:TetR family transcriptional regulator n=1 Tax=Deinococcus oregonensis TaxID=1805970 RepID=A0ABV6ATW4_9DEIO